MFDRSFHSQQRDGDGDLETLVRADLDRRADEVDPRKLFARIRQTLGADSTDAASATSQPAHAALEPATALFRASSTLRLPVARRVARWMGGLSAAAAAIVIAFLFGSQGSTAQASPESILRDAQKIHQLPLDRCYLVEVKKDSALLEQSFPMMQKSRVTRLWTRGDRYWIESVNLQQRFAWGRDEKGDFWIALGTQRGIRFAADEVPIWLKVSAEVYSMRIEHLLEEVLRDFDLSREAASPGQPSSIIAVNARLKPGRRHPALRGARIEFDGETKVVRKLVLERTRHGEPVATVTYLLVDTQPQDTALYTLEGQLEVPYEVYTSSDETQRRQWLGRFFGPMLNEMAPPHRPPGKPRPGGPPGPGLGGDGLGGPGLGGPRGPAGDGPGYSRPGPLDNLALPATRPTR